MAVEAKIVEMEGELQQGDARGKGANRTAKKLEFFYKRERSVNRILALCADGVRLDGCESVEQKRRQDGVDWYRNSWGAARA
jgi:hypothetical protein